MEDLIHYKTYGNKANPAFIIIHGLFGSLDNWQTLAKRWAEYFFVITIDVRNHGKSFHTDKMKFEDLSNDINNVLEAENINNTHILGHSMGGKIAMDYAANFPHKVNKLVVADVAPYKYAPHHNEVFNMLSKIDLTVFTTRQEIETEIRKYLHSESVVQFMSKNIRRNESTLQFEWKFNVETLSKNYSYLIERLPSKVYQGKTLFVGGQYSDYITKETSELIPDFFPNYEVEIISNAGHWLHADNPNEFFKKINHFLINK